MGFDSSKEAVQWFAQHGRLAQPLMTCIEMGYGFPNANDVSDLSDDQLLFLHMAWIERVEMTSPHVDDSGGGRPQGNMGGMTQSGPSIPPHLR